MAPPAGWTWVWADSGSWWWTGRPGVLWFLGSQRVGHDWETELNWTDMATHSSILAWKIPWTVWPTVLQRVGHNWATFTFTFHMVYKAMYICKITRRGYSREENRGQQAILKDPFEKEIAYTDWERMENKIGKKNSRKVRRHGNQRRGYFRKNSVVEYSTCWEVV